MQSYHENQLTLWTSREAIVVLFYFYTTIIVAVNGNMNPEFTQSCLTQRTEPTTASVSICDFLFSPEGPCASIRFDCSIQRFPTTIETKRPTVQISPFTPRHFDQTGSLPRPSATSRSWFAAAKACPIGTNNAGRTQDPRTHATRVAAVIIMAAWLLAGCPHPAPRHETARPGKPRAVNLQFAVGDVAQYQGKLVFAARVDLWGGSSKMSRRIWARFVLRRSVTQKTKQRTCFEDQFLDPRMGLGSEPRPGHAPPRSMRRNPGIVSVEGELGHMTVSWCVKASGGLANFSIEGAGRYLANLRIEQVLHRLYQLAINASVPDKPIGVAWKTTSRINTKMADAAMLVDLETNYACAVPTTCAIDERPPAQPKTERTTSGRPTSANSPNGTNAAAPVSQAPTVSQSTKAAVRLDPNRPACMELTGKERGIIPDFELKREGKAYKMGGLIKGRVRIVVDQRKATWRSWHIQRIMGIAATTKLKNGEATLGMRYDTTFLLRLTHFIPKATLPHRSHH